MRAGLRGGNRDRWLSWRRLGSSPLGQTPPPPLSHPLALAAAVAVMVSSLWPRVVLLQWRWPLAFPRLLRLSCSEHAAMTTLMRACPANLAGSQS